jgi:hypothetical protein
MFTDGFGAAYMPGIQQAFLESVLTELPGQAFGLDATGAMTGQGKAHGTGRLPSR